MSRCFPFPPPGYEKKIRTVEADSLIKEKQKKEKKHKKEKKDKEKKQGKGSKDTETSKDRHKKVHKEKKEKHRDRKDKDKSSTSEDRKKLGNGESKFIHDLARRVRDDEARESQSVGKIRVNNEKRINNTHTNFTMEKRLENAVRRGTEVIFKPLEKKDQAKKLELQEKNHSKESVIIAGMALDSEGIKKSEPKYTNCKEKNTEAINKIGQDKPKDVEGEHTLKERNVDTRKFGVHDLSRESVKTNGFLHENGSRPNKIQRPVASPISSVENGRRECQTSPKHVSTLQGTLCNHKAKEHRVNGFIKSQEPESLPAMSSTKAKENGEALAKKRPHSDLKYLDHILNVPKREELHEVGDTEEQEWLHGQSGMKLLKKSKTDSATTSLDETVQVWNQSISIESAGIVALPYVVPF